MISVCQGAKFRGDRSNRCCILAIYLIRQNGCRLLLATFAICCRPVRLSVVCLSVICLSSVTLVRPTQAVEIFGNISTAFGTLATH